jgi:hypothetical protein
MRNETTFAGQPAADRAEDATVYLRVPMEKESLSARELPMPTEPIKRKIYLIRGQKVMLDSDLAELYQVPTNWPLGVSLIPSLTESRRM